MLNDLEIRQFWQTIPNAFPETIHRDGWIVLDGVEYELQANLSGISKNYQWRVGNDSFVLIQPLVDYLRSFF